MGEIFANSDPSDQDLRRNYRVIGAVWIKQPGAKAPYGVFKSNLSFENTPEHTILAGETDPARQVGRPVSSRGV